MPYSAYTKDEARDIQGLGQGAREDASHGLYNLVLTHWFTQNYTIKPQVQTHRGVGRPEFIICNNHNTPVLIVELKRPAKWTTAGKEEVIKELREYLEGHLELTHHNTIYGLGGIGFHWMLCRMRKSEGPQPTIVSNWRSNITSNASFTRFGDLIDLIHNIE